MTFATTTLRQPRSPARPGPGPTPEALLRALDLSVGRRIRGLLPGEYRAHDLGGGTELAQVRPYEPGDDVRRIDWNVTARTTIPHVRVHVPERALTAWLLLDVSPSMTFGTADRRKADVAEGVAVAIGHLATQRGNRLGIVTFGGSRDRRVPPASGRNGLLGLLLAGRVEAVEEGTGATSPAGALRIANAAAPRGGRLPAARRRSHRPFHVRRLAAVARRPAPPAGDPVVTFAAPALLLGLLLVPAALVVYRIVQRRRSRYAVRFTNVDLLGNLVPRTPAWRRHVPPALYLGAIAALVFALARPSMLVAVPREQATIILTMDVSGSMQAVDVEPSRLAAAQKAASDFIDQLPPTFKVGLVAFSTAPRIVVQPTTDRAVLHQGINNLRAVGGTALGDAITTSLEAAGLDPSSISSTPTPSPSASPNPSAATPAPSASAAPGSADKPVVATVLLSDGKNSTGQMDPIPAAEQAAALGVPIYTIALGTADGVVQVQDDQGQVHTLNVPPDTQTLASIAETTGGRFFQAPTAQDLAQIYKSLGSRIGYTNEQQEVTQLFAAAGLLLVVTGAGLAAHWFNRFP